MDMFTPGTFGSLRLPNRLIRSAVWEAMADDDGCVTDRLVDCCRALAEGGVGLIILGYSYVAPDGKQSPGQTAIHDDAHVAGLRRVTDAVHEAGGRISCQLVHCGPQTKAEMIGGATPVGPSAVERLLFGTPRALSTGEAWQVIDAFGQAARRSVAAGFDAIQIHGAHGYLVSQFLSPLWNRRDDEFGGSQENRQRFAVEVYRAVRKHAAEVPVFIKLNLDDFVPGSTTPDDALPLATRLSEEGIDAIEVSAGGPLARGKGPARASIKKPEDEAYLMALARRTRAVIRRIPTENQCAVIGMGGFRSPAVIEGALASGDVDFVSVARPLIREPGLVRRWLSGDRTKALCVSCNGCYKTVQFGEGIQCWVEYKERTKRGANES